MFPYVNVINGHLFKNNDDIQIYSNHTNKTKYFPDIDDLTGYLDIKNTILNISVLELDINNNTKEVEDMEWFFNGRLQPDKIKIIVNDCYYYNDNVIVNEKLKKRFSKVEDIIPDKEKIGIYEILPLPNQRVDDENNPAEFQAIIDWALDINYSGGCIVKNSGLRVLDDDYIIMRG